MKRPLTIMSLILACLSWTLTIHAEEADIHSAAQALEFNIPEQPVGTALNEFAAQSGLQIVLYSDIATGLSSKPIVGRYENQEMALAALLANTGLEHKLLNENTVAIQAEEQEAESDPGKSRPASNMNLVAQAGTPAQQSKTTATGATDSGAEEAETGRNTIEEVLITARKREESLQDVPISISAFSEEYLNNANISSMKDLSQYVPGAQFEWFGAGRLTMYIRGVGSKLVGFGAEGAVGMYMDGVFLPKGWAGMGGFYDLERIEVLRGPQGTLYGRGSAGGTVNIITKRPSEELEVKVGAQVGNYNLKQVDVTISGPIIEDKLKARLTFSDSSHDGYINNLEGPDLYDENYTGIRGAVEWTPTDKLNVMFRGDYFDSDKIGQSNKLMSVSDTGLATASALAAGIPRSILFPDDFWTVAQAGGLPPKHYQEYSGLSATAEYELADNQILRSISAYRRSTHGWAQDIDATPLFLIVDIYDIRDTGYSQELQLIGSSNQWKWTMGLYYLQQKESIVGRDDLEFVVPGLIEDTRFIYKLDGWAAFANISFALSEKVTLEGGVRYSSEEGELVQMDDSYNLFPSWNFSDPKSSRSWDNYTFKLGANFQLTEDALLYASFSEGFKPGMYAAWNPPGVKWLEPELLTAYELGFKTDLLGDRLRVNGAVFNYDYKDKQVRTLLASTAQMLTFNATDASITGAELEIIARPIHPLTINASIAYLDAEYGEFMTFDSNRNLVDASGNSLENAPEWKLTFGAQYEVQFGDYGVLTVRGDVSWTDDQFYDQLADPAIGQTGYTIIDGLVRFKPTNRNWSFEFFAKNLTEKEYSVAKWGFRGDILGNIGAPRTFGLQVTWEY